MSLIRFPGLIDVHVHLREPGATHKEDFLSGSKAAVAGGFTYIVDMPNNPLPTFSPQALDKKMQLAQKALCEVGFHYGTNGKNVETFPEIWDNPRVFGLKLYCNHTTGDYLIEDEVLLEKVFAKWESEKPILVHAEGVMLEKVIHLTQKFHRRLHVCHISQLSEVELVRRAKHKKNAVTAGATPHHLCMTQKDLETKGAWAMMKPPLGTESDQQALWNGLNDGTLDIVETDHAPHTKEEKQGVKPMFGVPGLETAVGLLWRAVHNGKITEKKLLEVLHHNPRKIFKIPEQKNTYVELDPTKPYVVAPPFQTKCNWSPFEGWELFGKVETVVIGGKTVLEKGKVI